MNDIFGNMNSLLSPFQGLLVVILYKGRCPYAYAYVFAPTGRQISTSQQFYP